MNKQSAINLVKSTFENPYDRDRFLNFSRNLLHSFEPATFIYRGNYIPDAYKKQIKTLERLGKFEDSDKNKIDILAVCLNQGSTLERARTLQRNFISWYLNGSRGDVTKDAALVAFYVEGSHDWRLSLVKMEYRLGKSDAGRLKTFTELTPAKRFSFLVGENENTHTAQKQLLPTLIKEDAPPTLSDLEKVFSVEVVTKEFFEKYKQLFLETKEALDKIVKADPQIENDFKDKNIDTVDFTKKLLGQIVFLYFLQKKGWFGVARDENWGSGPKEFLRLLFEKNVIDYDNYFNDILEPLFYEALAIERPDDFYSRFDCKIPFLNGGLFDPLNNYDWVHTDIRLPNHLFSNDKLTKEGDHGTGILDVFDRYNFTVKEDEPLEREVAVDPEMLGKVFENLLEVKDRKSKGTYYTPREIVHYMCQESLVNYLATELEEKAKKEDIETLVQIGEAAVEHDTRVTEIGEETDTYSYKLPENIRKNAKQIDDALANIRVCDPAVGSGAFLVGMMTEIIRVRNTISSYFVDGDRSIYTFKHHAIQHSLYGVDIDPGATEIAKLRLWLSLIVDEQDIKKIKPLPNLDYKIMQGNSLLEEFEGIKLFDEDLFKKSAFDNTAQIDDLKAKMSELQREFFELYKNNQLQNPRKQQIEAELKKYNTLLNKLTKPSKPHIENTGLFDQESEAKAKAKELKRLQKEFFNTSHKKEKDQIKKRIESLTWELIEATLREQGKESLMREVEKYKKANIRPFFLWKLNFSEVFESKRGFDLIIGNPPYLRIQGIQKVDPELARTYKELYKSATGAFDLYVLFLERGLSLLKPKGILNFILPHKWVNAAFGIGIRRIINTNQFGKKIISFGAYQVFNASNYTSLLWLTNSKNKTFEYFAFSKDLINNQELEEALHHIVKADFNQIDYDSLGESPWALTDGQIGKVLNKLKGQPLSMKDVFDKIFQGIASGKDSVYFLSDCKDISEDLIRAYSTELHEDVEIEKALTKPLLKGGDVHRYATLTSKKIVIFPYKLSYLNGEQTAQLYTEEEMTSNFPKGFAYLKRCEQILRKREGGRFDLDKQWYQYSRKQGILHAEEEKLIQPDISKGCNFAWDKKGMFYQTTTLYGYIKKRKDTTSYAVYLAIFNSNLLWWYLKQTGSVLANGYFRFKTDYLKPFPLPGSRNTLILNELELLVKKIMDIKRDHTAQHTPHYEDRINKLVYQLYDLTPEEIAIVEEK